MCRREYDLTRCRLQEKQEQRNKTSSTDIDGFPLLSSPVRCEQPRSLDKNSRLSQAGLASSRNNRRSKPKKQPSWNAVDLTQAPEPAEMRRNGVTSDDELRHTSPSKNARASKESAVICPTTSEEWLSQVFDCSVAR